MADALLKTGTPIVFGVSGSFSPVDGGTQWASSITDTLTLAGVLDGAARQSTKVDLGAKWARLHDVFGCVDYTGETPTAGESVDYYWAPSTDATQADGNVAGNSGVDADAPGGALGSITLAEFLKQCIFIESLEIHDGAVVQNGYVGSFRPPTQWGQLVVVNNGGDAFENDDVEAHQVISPTVLDIT